MKKLLALLLLFATLFSLTACPAAGPAGPSGEDEEGEIQYLDTVGDKDFEGEEVVFSTIGWAAYEIYYEDEKPDVVDEELYKRNARLQDRFNVVITPLYKEADGAPEHVASVRNSVMNGDDAFDVSMVQIWLAGALVSDGWFYNLREWVPYVKDSLNGGADWWSPGINTAYTICGRQYIGVSDLNLSAVRATWCCVFNKQTVEDENIASKLGYESMYDYVRAGKWTLENFYMIVKDRYTDNKLSGSGVDIRDGSDTFGFVTNTMHYFELQGAAAGVSLVQNDGETTPELTPFTAFSKVAEDIYNIVSSAGYFTPTGTGKTAIDLFSEGTALFSMQAFGDLNKDVIHDSDVDYGVLPMPKANENQKQYWSGADDSMTTVQIPTTWYDTERMERVGAILEAMSAESHRVVIPAYYELVLKHKDTRDEESVEMIDLIYRGRRFNLSQIHSQGNVQLYASSPSGSGSGDGLYYVMRVFGKDPSVIATWWEASRDLLEIRLGEIIDDYNSIDA